MNLIKKGDKVKVLRKESYWYNCVGIIITVAEDKFLYPAIVRFDTVNYAGINTNNFSLSELELVK